MKAKAKTKATLDSEAVKSICAEIAALTKANLCAADLEARLNTLHQQLHQALGLSEEERAEIERGTEGQEQLEDKAFLMRLPKDAARALRAIVEGDKTKH